MRKQGARGKQKGQALIIIAGAIIGLMALVALAVDGGNAYAQRRLAQNAVDGATNAGALKVDAIWHHNWNEDSHTVAPMTADQNRTVLEAIVDSLAASGADTRNINDPPGTFEAWYTDCNGAKWGQQQVGVGFAEVPFCSGSGQNSPGVRGVWVQSTHSDRTYFAQIVGVLHVSADAHAAAEIGTPSGGDFSLRDNRKLWPITIMLDTLPDIGEETPLYEFNTEYAPGNWGILDYNGNAGGANDTKDWFENGFDTTSGTLMLGVNSGRHVDLTNFPDYPLNQTVWQPVQTGNNVSSAKDILERAASQHWLVYIPLSLGTNGETGDGLRYNVWDIGAFIVTHVQCCGSHNGIQGIWTGETWSSGGTRFSSNLHNALDNGLTVVRLSR